VRRNTEQVIPMEIGTMNIKRLRKNKSSDLYKLAAQAAEAAHVLNLLGNEKRLLILCYLMAGKELKVGDIVSAVQISQSALSQHLTKLREAGIVTFRRDSQTLYYRISDPRVNKLIKLLKSLYCEDIK
jgi:DNA-binding transcriptional ArsR family regulator